MNKGVCTERGGGVHEEEQVRECVNDMLEPLLLRNITAELIK